MILCVDKLRKEFYGKTNKRVLQILWKRIYKNGNGKTFSDLQRKRKFIYSSKRKKEIL